MTAKPVMPRAKAREDVEAAVDHYAGEGAIDAAFSFIAALEQAYVLIGEAPATGSPRWSSELSLPGLRSRRLKGFPWIVFYMEFETHVDVWRVLHAKRDLPTWVVEPIEE